MRAKRSGRVTRYSGAGSTPRTSGPQSSPIEGARVVPVERLLSYPAPHRPNRPARRPPRVPGVAGFPARVTGPPTIISPSATPTPSYSSAAPLLGSARILNVLAGGGVSWHIYPMGVKRQRAWRSLAGGLLGAIALSACGTLPATSMDHKSDPAAATSGVVQSLQRQIRERDKRIAELESRLDALKVIDQDMEKRRNVSRPPATLTPADSLFP